MKHYIKAGFDSDIKALPEAVQTWFHDKYEHFKDDVSWKNDAWPSFHVCDRIIDGKLHAILLKLSGLSDYGDSTIPGYLVVAYAYDENGEYFEFCGEDELVMATEANEDMDNIHWTEMFACIEQSLVAAK